MIYWLVAAKTDVHILITGETGTGKDVFARCVHKASPRNEGRFIKVNCAAMPGELLESEFFGYEKGAFTDAKTDKPGRFQMAEGNDLPRRNRRNAAESQRATLSS